MTESSNLTYHIGPRKAKEKAMKDARTCIAHSIAYKLLLKNLSAWFEASGKKRPYSPSRNDSAREDDLGGQPIKAGKGTLQVSTQDGTDPAAQRSGRGRGRRTKVARAMMKMMKEEVRKQGVSEALKRFIMLTN